MTADRFAEQEIVRRPPSKAKLFCSLIYQERLVLEDVLTLLRGEWGEAEFISPRFPFSHTSYYEEEMGSHLVRKFLTFEGTHEQDALPGLKWTAIGVERKFLESGRGRRVNIDPGLLMPDKLVLATTKSSAHRPYLGRGIYADLTLLFHNKSYRPLPWTYPDYASEETLKMLNSLRNRYRSERYLIQETESL